MTRVALIWRRWGRGRLGHIIVRPVLHRLLQERRAIRNSEIAVIALIAATGIPVGILVAMLHQLVNWLHAIVFDLPPGVRLSAEVHATSLRLAIVPVVGGLILGLTRQFRRRSSDIVDPIEANALRGGTMSLRDSLRLLISTLTSNGSGASVGMEAGYTQIGAAIFAACGRFFRLRREDRRIMVTAGAAAAIAAAFDAPLAGAFYGFELVQGGYSVRALTPVALAALIGAWMTRVFRTQGLMFAQNIPAIAPWIYPSGLVVGAAAAFVGILTMKSASVIEQALRQAQAPAWFRPAFAGAILGIIALGSPQVLGSGQGAIMYHLQIQWSVTALLVLLIAKIAASAICLGGGFRGGLFSSSLLIGCVLGAAVAGALAGIAGVDDQGVTLRLMGMAAVGASIIGAPLTMVFLVLESTGDFSVSIAILGAVLAAGTITRLKFGYSFATWRFHLRGLPLRGAYDIGWIKELTVGRLMRRDPKLVRREEPLNALQAAVAPGSAARLFAVDAEGRYVGAFDTALLHDPSIADGAATIVAADLASGRDSFLLPTDDIQAALRKFDTLLVEVLPVVSDAQERRVVGYLTEALALRRYTEELERHRSQDLGVPGVTN